MRSYRLARLAAIAVPLTIGLAVFLAGWLAPTISGAGLSEENRPIGFVLMSTFGAGGWVFGTSAMFTIFLSPARLPRAARLVAALVVRGLRSMASAEEIWRGEPAVTDHDRAVSRAHLLGLAVVELPLFLFLAPLLFGWLLQGDIYRPLEAASVSAMAILVVAWSVLLLGRASRGRPATG